uniref:Uncharacterized protein n=1 Tax=Cannabis sativa TaxID=3483 RepID=A0A803P5F0_CANSA
MFKEAPLSIIVRATILFAICTSTTRGSLCGKMTWLASTSVNVIVGSPTRGILGFLSSMAKIASFCSYYKAQAYFSLALPESPSRCGPPMITCKFLSIGGGINWL